MIWQLYIHGNTRFELWNTVSSVLIPNIRATGSTALEIIVSSCNLLSKWYITHFGVAGHFQIHLNSSFQNHSITGIRCSEIIMQSGASRLSVMVTLDCPKSGPGPPGPRSGRDRTPKVRVQVQMQQTWTQNRRSRSS